MFQNYLETVFADDGALAECEHLFQQAPNFLLNLFPDQVFVHTQEAGPEHCSSPCHHLDFCYIHESSAQSTLGQGSNKAATCWGFVPSSFSPKTVSLLLRRPLAFARGSDMQLTRELGAVSRPLIAPSAWHSTPATQVDIKLVRLCS